MHCWWSCELIQPFLMAIWNYAQRALKNCLPFDPAIPLLGLYPKEIIRKKTCTKIFLAALFVVAKNWKTRVCPSIWGMAEQIVVYAGDGKYCAQRNYKLEEFHVNWNNL